MLQFSTLFKIVFLGSSGSEEFLWRWFRAGAPHLPTDGTASKGAQEGTWGPGAAPFIQAESNLLVLSLFQTKIHYNLLTIFLIDLGFLAWCHDTEPK